VTQEHPSDSRADTDISAWVLLMCVKLLKLKCVDISAKSKTRIKGISDA
jgi:hypothetical protein